MKKLTLMMAAVALMSAPAFADGPKEVWKSKCASCHGEDGKAQTKQGQKYKVEDVTTAAWKAKHTDAKIKKAIEDGVSGTKMKGFKDKLSAAEIDALVKYTKSL